MSYRLVVWHVEAVCVALPLLWELCCKALPVRPLACVTVCAGADTLLGPEMRSTGEVMGIDKTVAKAYAKAAIAAGQKLPTSGNVFLTVMDKDKDAVVPIAKKLKVRYSLAGHPCVKPHL